MATLNKANLDISQTWIHQSDPKQGAGLKEPQNDDMFAFKDVDDDEVSVSTPTTAMTSSGSLLQDLFFENLDSLHDSANSFDEKPRSSRSSLQHPPNKKPSSQTRLNNSFSDIRSEVRMIGMDGTIMRIPSKAQEDSVSKLTSTASMPVNQKGKRGHRGPSTFATAPELRVKSMVAKCPSRPVRRPFSSFPICDKDTSSSLLRMNEVQSAICEVLTAHDDKRETSPAEERFAAQFKLPPAVIDERPRCPTRKKSNDKLSLVARNPSSSDQRSDFNVLHARTPSTSSTLSRRNGKSRVSELVMKVKASRASFQKLMDESVRTVEPESLRKTNDEAHTSRSMHLQQTSMEKQLEEKEEMIKKLSRQLQDARALNQKKDLEAARRKPVVKIRRKPKSPEPNKRNTWQNEKPRRSTSRLGAKTSKGQNVSKIKRNGSESLF
ncbi:unnamed protein product [Cylindrotheca closterium]|uniref:Uncharacterized protein n=1 Tax=Cylindrotheca closterium TaxID=2856 RepID=A0AAD2CQW0_9STRA|nr:unnamed protein product [Cylindrotheca closterium]